MTPDKHKAKLRKLTGLCDDEDIDMATERSKKKLKVKATHFVAIFFPVSDTGIHPGAQTVQQTVVSYEKRLTEPAVIPVKTLHLTLLAIRLKNEEQIEKAKEILQQCRTEILNDVLPSGAFTLKFKGVDFRFPEGENRQLLYVKPFGEEGIQKLEKVYAVVRRIFTNGGFPPTKPSRKFHPHVTVINLNNDRDSKNKGISEIPEKSFSTCEDLDFGEERVSSLCLCEIEMKKAKDDDSFFYNRVAKTDF